MFLPYAIAFSAVLTTKGMYRLPVPRSCEAATDWDTASPDGPF
jgi:hypothetical protein